MTITWDFPASWHNNVQISYEFKTQVLTSENGGEQRRAFRETPRVTVAQSFVLRRGAMQKFSRLVGKHQDDEVLWHNPTRYVEIADPFLSTTNVVTLADTPPSWLVVGSTVALVWDLEIEFHLVDVIAGNVLTLHEITSRDWPEGARVCQTYLGYMPTDITSTRQTDDLITLTMEFDSLSITTVAPDYEERIGTTGIPLGMLLGLTSAGSFQTFNGRRIFLLKPNWTEQPTWHDQRNVNDIDWGYGRVVRMTPVHYQTRVSTWTYLARTAAEADALVDFFCVMAGMQGEFYAPSWAADMDVIGNATLGASTLLLAGSDVRLLWIGDTVHKNVALFLTGNRKLFRQITNVVDSSGDSLMTISGVWDYAFTPDEVLMVCWLPVSRFTSDQITIEWLSDGKAQSQISIQTLEEKALDTV